MYSFDLTYVQAWSRPYIRSFDLIYVQVDLIYLTLDLIYQILTIYLKADFCPIWRVIRRFWVWIFVYRSDYCAMLLSIE